jgi:uncharacterized protein YraI
MKISGLKISGFVVAALLLAAPSAAWAARGIVTGSASLRAGPGAGFPVVDRIPGGAHVNIHGCIRGGAWCDISWVRDRGWVSARNLEYFYRNRYVYLPDYVEEVDYPVVPFVLSSYWASYYADRPFYRRVGYWNNYWQSNARFATTLPGRTAGVAATRGRLAATQARGSRAALATTRGAAVSPGRVASGRVAHVNQSRGMISRGAMAGTRQGVVGPQRGARFSAAPANRAVARPNMGRVAGAPAGRPGGATVGRAVGAPSQAHGQLGGAPRAMPQAAPGGGARIGGAAPAGGGTVGIGRGGGPAGGPPGGGPKRPH